ncbi:YciI family protein [Actinokineospora sp. NBRC 105648]|uniref:YciI family protein n=1 Tax=Actinokineospora sp. NBRC 105648 TaxID=3032206 RepID=UPI0024A25D01|nr:YciI family protein [Actinokineospora sp. NBRC 105648]GLZ39748.1 hypothetical protein Acsp05_33720 [Actinokineospora sp. NBRC 105648]
MAQYLLSIQQPDGPPPAPEVLDPIMRELGAFNQRLRDAGAWVFNAGLHAPETATVLRLEGDEVLLTDGPYAEGREHVGGFWVIEAADLDAALDWGRAAARILTLPIEVRPVAG